MIFIDREIMVIRGWEDPSAVKKAAAANRWCPFTPEFRLVAPYRPRRRSPAGPAAESAAAAPTGQLAFGFLDGIEARRPERLLPLARQRRRAFAAFRFSLPKEVARVLERFREQQWPLLLLLANDPGTLDLARTNPVLAFAVARKVAGDPAIVQTLRLSALRQRDLLNLLLLPATEATAKLFRKITPESVAGGKFGPLLAAFGRPESEIPRLLAHVSAINLGVMELVLDPRWRRAVTPTLLEEVAADPKEKYRAEAARLVGETIAMGEELGDRRPLSLVSREQLRAVHDEVAAAFQKLAALRRLQGPLPPPPLPGIDNRIIPLRTQKELVEEGRQQRNCVASYATQVKTGRCYIYCVLFPERATLSVEPAAGGEWVVGELKGPCNRTVGPATVDFVRAWIDRYRLGA